MSLVHQIAVLCVKGLEDFFTKYGLISGFVDVYSEEKDAVNQHAERILRVRILFYDS